jgi:hypothetical protein
MLSGLHSGQIIPAAQRSAYPLKSVKAPRAATTCDRADAAAVVLRQRIETLALQLAELEALRERVLKAEQKMEPMRSLAGPR